MAGNGEDEPSFNDYFIENLKYIQWESDNNNFRVIFGINDDKSF